MGNLDLRAYSAEQIAEILPAWEQLAESQPDVTLFSTPLWAVNYWRFRRQAGPPPTLLAGYAADGRLVGLAPLTRDAASRRARWLPTIRAAHSTGEYPSDWCCDSEWMGDFVAAVYAHMGNRERAWFQLTMNSVPEDSAVLEAMRIHCLVHGLPYDEIEGPKMPFVAVDGPESDALQLTTGKYRREILRKTRELAKLGELQFRDIRGLAGLETGFEEFVTVEGSGWKAREGGAIACQPDTRAFWSHVATEAAKLGKLWLHLLRCGDRTVAGQIGITWGNRYYCLKLGYDEEFRRFGPGAMVTQHALQRCIDDPGIHIYDFAGPAQPYMANWTMRSCGTYSLAVGHPALWPGLAFQGWQYGKKVLRGFRRTIRTCRVRTPPASDS